MEGAASQQAQQNSSSHRRAPDPAPSASSSRVTRSRQRVIDQVLAHDEPDEDALLAQQERKTPGSRTHGKALLRASTSAASLLTPPESETTGRSARDTAKGVRRSKRLSLLTPSESSPGEEAGAEEAHLVEQDEESPLKSIRSRTSKKRARSPTANAVAGPSRSAQRIADEPASKRTRRSSRFHASPEPEPELEARATDHPMADMDPSHRLASPPLGAGAKGKGKSKVGKGKRTSGKGKEWLDAEDAELFASEPEPKTEAAPRRSGRKSKKPALNNTMSDDEPAPGDSQPGPSRKASSTRRKSGALAAPESDVEDTGGDMDIDAEDEPVQSKPEADAKAAPGSAAGAVDADAADPYQGLGDDLPPSLRAAARGLMGGLFGGFGFGDIGSGLDAADGLSAFGATPRQAADILKKSLPAMRDPKVGVRKNALSQVAELLISQPEDILGAYFSVDAFTTEFVAILSGKPNVNKSKSKKGSKGATAASDEDDDDDDVEDIDDIPAGAGDAYDEDAEMARILAMSAADAGVPFDGGGGAYGGGAAPDEVESQMFAARCMANMVESMPGSSHTIVQKGGIAVLCAKLMEIEYMDLAGQVLCTLEKLAKETPSQIVREGGLHAMLQYLDFHDMNDQQTALQAAAACCRGISAEHFDKVNEVMPIVRGVLGWSTQKQVDPAASIVIRIMDSYRTRPDLLKQLLSLETVKAINHLFLPGNASSLLKPATFINLLRSVTVAARASPRVAHTLFEAEVAASMYCILTGLLPPALGEDDDMTTHLPEGVVSQNLAQNPREQIEEALTLMCELLPPLPRDGAFDPRQYSDKLHQRYVKAAAKADKAGKTGASRERYIEKAVAASKSQPLTAEQTEAAASAQAAQYGLSVERLNSLTKARKDLEKAQAERMQQLRDNPKQIHQFVRLLLPVLVELYSASPAAKLRSRVLNGLTKAIAFCDGPQLRVALKAVPLASFLSSILATRDNPPFVLASLQMVEILLDKLSDIYSKSFLREGVYFEIQQLAKEELSEAFVKARQEAEAKTAAEQEPAVKVEPTTPGADPHQSSSSVAARESAGSSESEPSPPALPKLDLAAPAGATTSRLLDLPPFAISAPGEVDSKPTIQQLNDWVAQRRGPGDVKRISSVPSDPKDANILRAKVLLIKQGLDGDSGETNTGDGDLAAISADLVRVTETAASKEETAAILERLSVRLQDKESPLSSFELLQSGLLSALLKFVTTETQGLSKINRDLLFEALTATRSDGSPSSLSLLLKRLHESLSKLEDFEVESASGGLDDSKRSSLTNLARTLRVKLVAEPGTDIPKAYHNMIVSIQGIAPISAVSSYLRQRVAQPLSSLYGGSRSDVQGMLAAYAGLLGERRNQKAGADAADGSTAETSQQVTAAGIADPSDAGPSSAGLGVNSAENDHSGELAELAASSEAMRDRDDAEDGDHGMQVDEDGHPVAGILDDVNDYDDDDDYEDDDMYDDGMGDDDGDRPAKTVDLAVNDDGTGVTAKTPEGTRVATPDPGTSAAESSKANDLPPKVGSYAAAVKTAPTDWHFSFSIGDTKLSNAETVYGAVHRSQTASAARIPLWNLTPTIRFKKVDGPAPAMECDSAVQPDVDAGSVDSLPSSLGIDSAQATILRMMRVLHSINATYGDTLGSERSRCLAETAFVNNKLTAKFIRQLDELIIVASDCLPDWAHSLPFHFPFLFPFDARYTFLQSTSFGYSRLIGKWLSQHQNSDTRRSSALDTLPRPQRCRVRISRSSILESAVKVMELYGAGAGVLEIEYFDEVGTGLGPTLEFYSLASKAFARRELKIWRDEDEHTQGEHVHHPSGLFPRPVETAGESAQAKKVLDMFKIIGIFVGKALLDSRIIDCNFNKVFMKSVLGQRVENTLDTLSLVDPAQASSLRKLQEHSRQRSPEAEVSTGSALLDHVEHLGLDFTLPGHPEIELLPDGSNKEVTSDNVQEYIDRVIQYTLIDGIKQQVASFKEGFSTIFPVNDLNIFTPEELVLLFGDPDEDWSAETLRDALTADHGYSLDAPTVSNLIDIMASYDHQQRRDFLQFITGAPKLPIGGFRSLHPKFTVVKKTPDVAGRNEVQLTADQILPSVMTCASYLKLPDYSSKAILAERLLQAATEGAGAFHMS